MFQSLLDLLLLTLRFDENKQVDLGLQEFILLGKEEDAVLKFAQFVGKWGIITLIAPTLILKWELVHLYQSQTVNQGVDDQEFAQFVDNPDTLEVDVMCNLACIYTCLNFGMYVICNEEIMICI